MKAIVNARIVLPHEVIPQGYLLFDRKLLAIGEGPLPPTDCKRIDGTGFTVTPGLVDLHMHGLLGKDFTDGIEEDNLLMAKKLPEFGVTGFLPTVMTVPRPNMVTAFEALRPLVGRNDLQGAVVLGINSEGPFLSQKRKGAQDPNGICAFDEEFVLRYQDLIRIMSVAPEEKGAEVFIRNIKEKTRIVLSVGHSDGTFAAVKQAADLGLSHVTHLFNAMSPMNHREPGVAGAALSLPSLSCELIADGFHVHPALFPLIARAKGKKLCIITDSVRPAGLPDGTYTDGSGATVTKTGIACRLPDGTIAGSVLTMNEGLKNWMRATSLSLSEAVYAATAAPADVIGEKSIGRLSPGCDADLVIWDEDWNIKQTVLKGDTIYEQCKTL